MDDEEATYRVEANYAYSSAPDVLCEGHSIEGAKRCARSIFEAGDRKWVRIVCEQTGEVTVTLRPKAWECCP